MVKLLFLVLFLMPPIGYSEPSMPLDELIAILQELETAQIEVNQGLGMLNQGLNQLYQGQIELRTGLSLSKEAQADQQERLRDLELSLASYKQNVKETVIPIVEDQARQLTGAVGQGEQPLHRLQR